MTNNEDNLNRGQEMMSLSPRLQLSLHLRILFNPFVPELHLRVLVLITPLSAGFHLGRSRASVEI